MSSELPNTYHVIEAISTYPTSVPLPDYCRHHHQRLQKTAKKLREEIEKTWCFIEQKSANDNEKIRIYFNPAIWKCSHTKE
ncbi:MAG: hypothetical protein A3I60_01565 [Sulfuricurvum sp. RIFCSPLOWO2_02_FULL_43_45]|nr:MAG: hypothetical protein A3I60_01565 [Sulfuricurvum sp. RIFCSPLOWO2_02_FULL_43_45]